jgi:prefoldin subunit 5
MTISEDLAAGAATIDARLAALAAEAQAISDANAAGAASRAAVQEVADLLRTLAPQVAALEQGDGDPQVIADLEAQIAALQAQITDLTATHDAEVTSLQTTVSTLQAQVTSMQATITDLEAQLAAGGGEPPAGVLVRATAWPFNERGGLFVTNDVWSWSAHKLDDMSVCYGKGTLTVDADESMTMEFTAPLTTGQFATVVVTKQNAALPPHEREVWSGVWHVPVTEVV